MYSNKEVQNIQMVGGWVGEAVKLYGVDWGIQGLLSHMVWCMYSLLQPKQEVSALKGGGGGGYLLQSSGILKGRDVTS